MAEEAVVIPYMGNKHWAAHQVATLVEGLRSGPFLDLFSGMCSIGQSLSETRPLWCNDVLKFPYIVASVLFGPGRKSKYGSIEVVEHYFNKNQKLITDIYEKGIRLEKIALSSGNLSNLKKYSFDLPYCGQCKDLEKIRVSHVNNKESFPSRLFVITYAGSYFGLYQCAEIDSIRYGIDSASAKNKISKFDRNAMLLALGIACLRTSNSTGHFAEYLDPTEANKNRVLRQRRRSIWDQFTKIYYNIGPLGSSKWRRKNQTFQVDAVSLLERLAKKNRHPAVIYADPPYSKAQYSRYYHLLDTIVHYDYPKVTAKGRYPEERFQTAFSHKAKVEEVMTRLIECAAALNSDLVLSYPSNGLLFEVGSDPGEILRSFYRKTEIQTLPRVFHSSFGGSNALPKYCVSERIYIGQHPKT